ncbi:MAG: hypothetical protein D6732_04575 [Methanobacteriota archaeon]|nr:MAG: hypothetical protein D6732_04575 [Euryarchaeota archaeon]
MYDKPDYIELLSDVYSQIRDSLSGKQDKSAEEKASAVFDAVMAPLKEYKFLGENTALFIPSRFQLKSGDGGAKLLDTSCYLYSCGNSEIDYSKVYKSFILYYLMLVINKKEGMAGLLNKQGKLEKDFYCLATREPDKHDCDIDCYEILLDDFSNDLYNPAFKLIDSLCNIDISRENRGCLDKLHIFPKEEESEKNANDFIEYLADDFAEDDKLNALVNHFEEKASNKHPFQFINLAHYAINSGMPFNYYFPTVVTTVQSTHGAQSVPGVLVLSSLEQLDKGQIRFIKVLSNIIWKTISQIDISELERLAAASARKAANISILVDSFAHNVASHSLAALSQFFGDRKSLLEKEGIYTELSFNGPTSDIRALTIDDINKIKSNFDEGKDKLSLADVIQYVEEDSRSKMFSFYQKNADPVNLPVPIDNLIYNFINYLYEKAEFWSAVIAGETFNHSILNMYELIFGFVDNPIFLGTLAANEGLNKVCFYINGKKFALIDFSVMQSEHPHHGNYQFIEKCEEYASIKKDLEKKQLWLPGGNVGRQAVYTIFENCIRNIKHYDINKINEGKIKFHLDLEETKDMFNMKIYLGHTDFYGKKKVQEIVEEIKSKINLGTFDAKNSHPVMGGISQSILCAYQLLTGKFIPERKDEQENCFQVCEVKNKGSVAYTFKIWKGEKLRIISRKDDLQNAKNLSRFEILVAKRGGSVKLTDLKNMASDMVRVIESDKDKYNEVYEEWLKKWLGDDKFKKGIKLHFDGEDYAVPENSENKIEFLHGDSQPRKLHFRNHGVFKRRLCENWEDSKYDVMESMLTGVYAVDDRLFKVWESRVKVNDNDNELMFSAKLLLNIKGESDPSALNDNWITGLRNRGETPSIRKDVNFLIVHLSFIEKLCDDFKKDVNNFIEKVKEAVGCRENFHLVITTGRGRTDWKSNIKDDYKSFVKYRSIYSLQRALINATMIGDDFDVKYNLTKVLFGS